jgi:hypothetical protein
MKSLFKKIYFKWFLLVLILVPGVLFAINTVSEGFRINKSNTTATIDAHGVCAAPTNNSSTNDYFVPTATLAEWASFRSNPPQGVTIGSCGPVIDCVGSWTNLGSTGINPEYGGECIARIKGTPSEGCPILGPYGGSACTNRTFTHTYIVTTSAQNGGAACSTANGATINVRCSTSSGSFIAGTLVTLPNGTYKNIEEIRVGDIVKGYNANNMVVELKPRLHKGNVYGINGKKVFATGAHPFRTTNGWKSFDETIGRKIHPELDVQRIKVGDILLKENGETERVESISYEYQEVQVYNFEVSGERDYFADGYSVHNK